MTKYIHELISPSGFTKKERREYRIGLALCIACMLFGYLAIAAVYAVD